LTLFSTLRAASAIFLDAKIFGVDDYFCACCGHGSDSFGMIS